jgi:hypothetical protein
MDDDDMGFLPAAKEAAELGITSCRSLEKGKITLLVIIADLIRKKSQQI